MKAILIVALILLCGTAVADHHIVAVIVWDEPGTFEANVPITFTFDNQSYIKYTATDGSCCFDCMNFPSMEHNDTMSVSSNYGNKIFDAQYYTNETIWNETNQSYDVHSVANWGTGVTFNEPDKDAASTAFMAMGLVATVVIGGIYRLRKKVKSYYRNQLLHNNEVSK